MVQAAGGVRSTRRSGCARSAGCWASHAPTKIGRAFIGSPVPISVHCRADWARRLAKIRMVVCYDAGFGALWPAGSLAELGIECRVLDFASIQLIAGRVV